MNKVPIAEITIERAEGPSALCGIKHTFHSWEAANCWLLQQSSTFPKTGCYDKHDFKVVFADGEVYEGRLDCKAAECSDNDLDVKAHIRSFCIWYAGLEKNPHCGMERYMQQHAIEQKQNPGSEDAYKRFIELYL